jgi:hypothetical protein
VFKFTPRLSGENSIIAALATAALVIGIYNMKVGPVADVHASDAGDGNLAASVKKAGWEAVVAVAGLTLLANDANIAILGGAAIIAEELSYRHAMMTNPASGQIQVTPASYQSAGAPSPVGSTALGVYSGQGAAQGSGIVEAQAG